MRLEVAQTFLSFPNRHCNVFQPAFVSRPNSAAQRQRLPLQAGVSEEEGPEIRALSK